MWDIMPDVTYHNQSLPLPINTSWKSRIGGLLHTKIEKKNLIIFQNFSNNYHPGLQGWSGPWSILLLMLHILSPFYYNYNVKWSRKKSAPAWSLTLLWFIIWSVFICVLWLDKPSSHFFFLAKTGSGPTCHKINYYVREGVIRKDNAAFFFAIWRSNYSTCRTSQTN